MKVEKQIPRPEFQAIAWLARDTKLLSLVFPHRQRPLFLATEANKLAKLCFDFYEEHKKAPRAQFASLVNEKYPNVDGTLGLACDTVDKLTATKADFDAKVALCKKVFWDSQVQRFNTEVEQDKAKGRFRKNYTLPVEIELVPDAGTFFGDEDLAEVQAGFAEDDPLFTYPDELGIILRGGFAKKHFTAFIAREKIGKSYWLLDAAWRALENGQKVAYISTGDMTTADIRQRLMCRLMQKPYVRRFKDGTYEETIKRIEYPLSIDGQCEWTVKPMIFKAKREDFLDPVRDWPKCQRKLRRLNAMQSLRVADKPNNTCSVEDIDNLLEGWRLQYGFAPDVVVVDYADTTKFPSYAAKHDYRHQIDFMWRDMRQLSIARNCLVLTATQATRFNRKKTDELLDADNISEDKRKLAHVTAMFGINRMDVGQERYKLNCIVKRKGRFKPEQAVCVGGCLEFGLPAVVSALAD